MPCLVKLDPVVLENKFYEIRLFIFIYFYFRHLVIISLWNRAWTFDWTNLNPFTQKCLVQSSVEVCQWFLRRFLKFINLFSLFRFYLPLEKGIALHFYSDYPMMLCAKFGWNWPSASVEEDENVKSLLAD